MGITLNGLYGKINNSKSNFKLITSGTNWANGSYFTINLGGSYKHILLVITGSITPPSNFTKIAQQVSSGGFDLYAYEYKEEGMSSIYVYSIRTVYSVFEV